MALLTLITDSEVTDDVLSLLATLELEHQALIVRQVRTEPPGDQIQVQIHRAQIDRLVAALQDGALHDRVDVMLQPTDDLVSRSLNAAPPDDDDVAVWAQVRDDLLRSGRLSGVNLALIVVAAMIAALGIIQDQLLLVVGAMAISPDYFLVALPCLAAVWGRWHRMARGIAAIVIAFAAAAAGAWALTMALHLTGVVTEDAYPSHELLSFIVHPDMLSIVVALLAGVAGGVGLTLSDGRGLVGVFVSITTIPAAANIGVALAARDWSSLGGASAQLGVNLLALMAAVTATLALRRIPRHQFSTPTVPDEMLQVP